MYNFLQLVTNENMKIYRRARTWIMFGILIALVLLISIVAKLVGNGDANSWSMMLTESGILLTIVTIFAVVVSADSVAGEFTTGTIKLLLIRPWSRSKILLSKYISLLLFALIMTVVLFVLTFAVNVILFGYDGSGDAVGRALGVQRDIPAFAYMLLYYISSMVPLLITVTLSFMLSTVFRSGGLAIGLALFVLLAGGAVSGLLGSLDYEWVKYVLFINMDLTGYLNKTPMAHGLTLGFSLGVLVVYYVVFVALTWLVFNKRDVAA